MAKSGNVLVAGIAFPPSLHVSLNRMMVSEGLHSQPCTGKQMKELRIPYDPNLVAGLFASITAAGSYASEIWATPFLHKWHLKARECALDGYPATRQLSTRCV